jgi:hypothetical protein
MEILVFGLIAMRNGYRQAMDGIQPRRHAGTVGTAQPSADFPHDGRHKPLDEIGATPPFVK